MAPKEQDLNKSITYIYKMSPMLLREIKKTFKLLNLTTEKKREGFRYIGAQENQKITILKSNTNSKFKEGNKENGKLE